jgi:hypothetical protein
MQSDDIEYLLYGGESPKNCLAYQRYLEDVQRGKSLQQLLAVHEAITPIIRQSWSARSFTPVQTPEGRFDEVVCNISYHFHKHGQKFGDIGRMTEEALRYFQQHQQKARVRKKDGLLVLPNGSIYEASGKIVTFVG